MKNLEIYKNLVSDSYDESKVFKYFLDSLKPSITLWNYFVNWDKVFNNTAKIEIKLNILNYLIGKDNFNEEFKFLLREHPEVVEVIPALIVRNGGQNTFFKIVASYEDNKLIYEDFDFSKTNLNEHDIDKYLEFVIKSGLKNIFLNQKVKNLVDYMIGVEAGLDSNGRKNRGGSSMETITESFINTFCIQNNYAYIPQATQSLVKSTWNIDLPVYKSMRRYDFIINTGKELIIIETNFYGSNGSKLKATSGEYRTLNNFLQSYGYKFIWITDGYGWHGSHVPLSEAFTDIDYIFNLKMLENDILSYIILNQP